MYSNKKPIMIINADDYGMSPQVSRAIILSLNKGLISDTSVLATHIKEFSENYIPYLKDLFRSQVGIHFCLTAGMPITENIKNIKLLCNDDGSFSSSLSPSLNLDGEYVKSSVAVRNFSIIEKSWIYDELMAQASFLNDLGLELTHADSHQHIHLRMDLLPMFVKICKELDIPFLRISSREKGLPIRSKIATLCKKYYIRLNRINTVDLFGGCTQVYKSDLDGVRVFEVMCHPQLNQRGKLVDKSRKTSLEDSTLLDINLKRLLEEYEITNYAHLIKR